MTIKRRRHDVQHSTTAPRISLCGALPPSEDEQQEPKTPALVALVVEPPSPTTADGPRLFLATTGKHEQRGNAATDIWEMSSRPPTGALLPRSDASWKQIARIDHTEAANPAGDSQTVTALCWIPVAAGLRLAVGFSNGRVSLCAVSLLPQLSGGQTVKQHATRVIFRTCTPVTCMRITNATAHLHEFTKCGVSDESYRQHTGTSEQLLAETPPESVASSSIVISTNDSLVDIPLASLDSYFFDSTESSSRVAPSMLPLHVSFASAVSHVASACQLRHAHLALGHEEHILGLTPDDIQWLRADGQKLCSTSILTTTTAVELGRPRREGETEGVTRGGSDDSPPAIRSRAVRPAAADTLPASLQHTAAGGGGVEGVTGRSQGSGDEGVDDCLARLRGLGYVVAGSGPFLSVHWIDEVLLEHRL